MILVVCCLGQCLFDGGKNGGEDEGEGSGEDGGEGSGQGRTKPCWCNIYADISDGEMVLDILTHLH